MKTIRILILMSLITVTLSAQENYKILFLNTSDIKIGGQICRVGDCFSEDAIIEWENDKQAMKVLCLSNNRQSVIIAKQYKSKHYKSLSSYLIQNKHLSARAGALSTTTDLKHYLSNTFYLIDTIRVNTPLPTDIRRFFYVSYIHKGELINKKINCNNGSFIIDKSIFNIDGLPIPAFETTISVYYLDEQKDECTLLSSDMHIIPVEESLSF